MSNDHDPPSGFITHAVHWSLLSGLVVSSLLLVAGLILESGKPDVAILKPPVPTVPLKAAFQGDGRSMLNLGLLALIATPVVRVAVLVVGWRLERKGKLALTALIVLALLLVSLTIGVG